jgi:hypothetical protein
MKESILNKLTFFIAAAVLLASFAPTTVFAAPLAPSGLVAQAFSGRVDLSWTDNSPDETGFNVERAPDIGGLGAGTYAHLGSTPTVSANVTTYTDTTVAPVTAYWYRVSAANLSGSSFPSNETRILTSVSGPVILPTQPASGGVVTGGTANTLTATATVSGSTIVSAEYQLVANNAAGTFDARDIYGTQMDLTILARSSGAAVINNSTAVPAGLPAGAIVEFEIWGNVASVAASVWTIGNSAPFTVYESVANPTIGTKFIGSRHPVAGDAVKITAYRTVAAGPLIAKTITFIAPAPQPAAAPSLILTFLFDGVVQSVQPPAAAPGYLVSGATWTVGAGHFRVDSPEFPAYVDPGVGAGTAVTVRFATSRTPANLARQIFNQINPAIGPTTKINPVFDKTPIPANVPAGTWLYVIVDGVVSNVDLVNGVWTVGTEQVMCYQTAATLVGPATVGDEVLFYARRTLAPGPLVLEQTYQILPGPLSQPYKPTAVETHLMYNGAIQAMGANTWTVGGQTFVVDDPEGKARIDPLPLAAFAIGNSVTVEFDHVGEVLPDNANWAPMSQVPATTTWNASMVLPGVSANQTGTLFLRTTDATQQGSTTAVSVTLAASGALSASSGAASNIAASSAIVHGNLVSMGTAASASVNFEWGTVSGALTNTTPVQTVAVPGTFAATISGLSPSTVYYFRSKAVAGAGTVFGAQLSFTTAAASTGGGGGGGGGGGFAPPPTNLAVSLSGLTGTLTLNTSGVVQTAATLTGGGATLTISAGVTMKTSTGSSLGTLTMSAATGVPAAPSGRVIVLAQDFGPGGATFDPPLTLTLTYDQSAIPAGVSEGSLVIAYWDGTKWVTLSTSVNADANTVSASISHFTFFAILGTLPPPTTAAPAVPARFDVSKLAVSPVECKPGDTVTITATTVNTGGTEGQYEVVLLVNGAKQDAKTVTLRPGASAEVKFTTTAGTGPRIYVADVNGTQSTFVVQAPATTAPAPSPTPAPAPASSSTGWLIGGLIAAGLGVIVLLVVLIARKPARS